MTTSAFLESVRSGELAPIEASDAAARGSADDRGQGD
jgi:hypothetical protein